MINVITWLWGTKYTPEYVMRLYRGVKRNLKQPFRFLLMTERERMIDLPPTIERHAIKDPQWLERPGCFARLRMFDRGWQHNRELAGKIVCLDLDLVVTGELDGLFARDERLVILAGANSLNPCPFNCSVMMFWPGAYPELWEDFDDAAAQAIPFFKFPDDQGWIAHRVPNAGVWRVGASSGIYAFRKPAWPPGDRLPDDAKIVAFPGSRDPAMFVRQLPWIAKHWV